MLAVSAGVPQPYAAAPTSHRQNDAELRLAAHHSRVSLGRFFERIGFDHGTHAGQFSEVAACPRNRRVFPRPSLESFDCQ